MQRKAEVLVPGHKNWSWRGGRRCDVRDWKSIAHCVVALYMYMPDVGKPGVERAV